MVGATYRFCLRGGTVTIRNGFFGGSGESIVNLSGILNRNGPGADPGGNLVGCHIPRPGPLKGCLYGDDIQCGIFIRVRRIDPDTSHGLFAARVQIGPRQNDGVNAGHGRDFQERQDLPHPLRSKVAEPAGATAM
jgi:hypothetical protein